MVNCSSEHVELLSSVHGKLSSSAHGELLSSEHGELLSSELAVGHVLFVYHVLQKLLWWKSRMLPVIV
jgi:hypothetical protein